MNVVCVNKPQGWTPLMAIDAFRQRHAEHRGQKISYAGRLDPMAEGLLLLLIGDENRKRHAYEDLTKEYEVEIVFGISTDSYDALGVPSVGMDGVPALKEVEDALHSFVGKRQQAYPPYSSKAVNGKPLYWWARSQRISEIEIPAREVEIYDLRKLSSRQISGDELIRTVGSRVGRVSGEFRQKEILNMWKKLGEGLSGKDFQSITVFVKSSSGTYMRSLAHEVGLSLSCGAFAMRIKRTKVGPYSLSDALVL